MNDNNCNPFWSESENGKTSLDSFEFKEFLEQNNFFKNKPNEKSSFNLIKKDGIFLKIQDEVDLKDFVLNYILKHNLGKRVYNLMTGKTSIFTRQYLSMIKSDEISTLKDNKDTAYILYLNGVLEVTKDKSILKKYSDYGLNIWEDQVIKRNYVDSDHHESEYRTFIWKIAGENVERYNTFQSVIGYLLHSYRMRENKAIILNDEAISDDPNGRSGKGVFWNSLQHLKKVGSLNGKFFDFKSQFPYQSISTDCQVLVFDDVKKNFDFENLFSIITEGIEITYKGKDTIKLPLNDSPKVLITTNYILKGKGGSHDARRFEVELSPCFNSNYTPVDLFGHRLFDDWDLKEWARFDCYMVECLKKYLDKGLINYHAINLPFKRFESEIGKELLDCISNVNRNEWVNSTEFYDNYTQSIPKRWNAKTKNAVTIDLKKYCSFYELEFETVSSNGIRKFKINEININPQTLEKWNQ
jgi:hypothetical protein